MTHIAYAICGNKIKGVVRMATYNYVIQQLKELIKTVNRHTNGKRKTTTQQQFDTLIQQLKEFGIMSFDKSFLYNIAKDYSLNVRQRIGRLLTNSKVLKVTYGKQYKQRICYVIQ